ncbi:EAL domain-containing protein [Vibrio rotiferianus]|uniref:EAL domain-containing protein n=1 Tax=Vibrio rotiferianus TaxID=190895 RepID=UPI0024915CDB|nr:EAL domain-containing protein [Vibrio rotiferianus]
MPNFRLLTLNLRYKTALYFSLGLLGMIISFLFISRYFFLYSLDELERTEITHANQQAHAVINMMVNQQREISYDWAHWDETYYLLKDGDIDAYRDRNLYIESIDTLALDLMVFVTLEGKILDSLTREQDKQQSHEFVKQVISLPEVKDHILNANNTLDIHRDSMAGLFKINQHVWSVSLTPVRNSEGDQNSPGWLVWGRDLNLRFPGDFSSILTANNQLVELSAAAENESLAGKVNKNGNNITLWSVLTNVSNQPIALLKTDSQRPHYEKGNTLFLYLFATIGVVATAIASSTYWVFKNRVAIRFNHFSQGIRQLASQYHLEDLRSVTSDELEVATKLVEKLSENTSITKTQLKDSMQKLGALYRSSSLGMLIVIERNIVDINQQALDMLKYQRDDIIDRPLDSLCASDTEECHVDMMFKMVNDGTTMFEAQMLDSKQQVIDCSLEATLVQHNGCNALMLLIHDLREKKQQAQLIQELTDYDPISGFCNRVIILSALNDLIRQSPNSFSFVYISCENIQQISQLYGHRVFDEAIKYISASMKTVLGEYQIGRISESEFIVLVPDCSHSNNQQVVDATNKLLDRLSHKVELSGLLLNLESKAVIIDPAITHEPSEHLLQIARYSASSLPGNQMSEVVVVAEELSSQAQTAMIINRDLELAIKNREIIPYYQPILNTQSGEVIGFEALARWIHPVLGVISPAVFIPIAEQGKLIVELGESILEQACEFLNQLNKTRKQQGLNALNMHVNLSTQHFYHANLTSHLKQALDNNCIEAGQLVIEITESMLMGVEAETIHRINEVKQLGTQLALDDFGTGYASFSSLCSFPLDIVKLDKSYIDQIETNDRAKTLVRNIASMAQELGLTIVAEGVETASQVRKLKVWSIDELQGFYFYKPMPKQDILDQFSSL